MRAVSFTSGSGLSFHKLLKGALVGFFTTAPMSLSMIVGWRRLPGRKRYPLPPRLIAEKITEGPEIGDPLTETEPVRLTIFSYFGYGADIGTISALLEPQMPLQASHKGAMAGAALWTCSYLGWGVALGEGLQKLTEDDKTRSLIRSFLWKRKCNDR